MKGYFQKKKIYNTFFKMRLVSTIENLMAFIINTGENVLYYGENSSSRFLNRLYYGESGKNVFFDTFLNTKNQKMCSQELKSVHELIDYPKG